MNYFMGEFTKDQSEQKSELKRWGRAGALMATGGVVVPIGAGLGGLSSALINKKAINKVLKIDSLKNHMKSTGMYKPKTAANLNKYQRKLLTKIVPSTLAGALGGATLAGAGTYGAYRGGKALINKIRNRKKKN